MTERNTQLAEACINFAHTINAPDIRLAFDGAMW